MDDKELDAIIKCHTALKDLSNDSKKRIFRYLYDRYNIDDMEDLIRRDQDQNDIGEKAQDESGNQDNSKSKRKSTNKSRRTSSGNGESYSLISDLNLIPNGMESLKDFYSKYKVSNNFEKNIVILYYLKNILGIENVGIDHIYTCYKHLSIRIPILGQSLRDTKSRKGWIDTSNSDDLKVTVAGENYIEHEIEKAQ